MTYVFVSAKAIEVEGTVIMLGDGKYAIYISKKYADKVQDLKGKKVKVYIVVED